MKYIVLIMLLVGCATKPTTLSESRYMCITPVGVAQFKSTDPGLKFSHERIGIKNGDSEYVYLYKSMCIEFTKE